MLAYNNPIHNENNKGLVLQQDTGDQDRIFVKPGHDGSPVIEYHMQYDPKTPHDAAFVDQISFSFKNDERLWGFYHGTEKGPEFHTKAIQERYVVETIVSGLLHHVFGFHVGMDRGKGLYRYARSWQIFGGFGFVCIGTSESALRKSQEEGKDYTQRDTILVQITGEGMAFAAEGWQGRFIALQHALTRLQITRLDLAADFIDGKDYNINKMLADIREGHYQAPGKMRPRVQLIGDFLHDDETDGRTIYVGRRENGKLGRGYEKGKQLKSVDWPDWFRIEGEWHNRDRIIPLEAVLNPGGYLAGAWSALSFLHEIQCKIKSTVRAAVSSLENLVYHCRRTYGKLLNVVIRETGLNLNQKDHGLLLDLIRDGEPDVLHGLSLADALLGNQHSPAFPCPF